MKNRTLILVGILAVIIIVFVVNKMSATNAETRKYDLIMQALKAKTAKDLAEMQGQAGTSDWLNAISSVSDAVASYLGGSGQQAE